MLAEGLRRVDLNDSPIQEAEMVHQPLLLKPKGYIWFLSRFGIKYGIDFDQFVLKKGKVCAP